MRFISKRRFARVNHSSPLSAPLYHLVNAMFSLAHATHSHVTSVFTVAALKVVKGSLSSLFVRFEHNDY